MAGGVVARPASIADCFSRGAERLLRTLGDARSGLALLLLTGAWRPCSTLRATAPGWRPVVTAGAVAFWLPRRRLTVRPAGVALHVNLGGERTDRPTDEGARLQRLLVGAA